ncbi:hypothetical protein ACFL2K_05420, partial [Candidatus Margulisiibacteriota bacterium]
SKQIKPEEKKNNYFMGIDCMNCTNIRKDIEDPNRILDNAYALRRLLLMRKLAAKYALKKYNNPKEIDLWALGLTFFFMYKEKITKEHLNATKIDKNRNINSLFNVLEIQKKRNKSKEKEEEIVKKTLKMNQ